MIDCQTCGQPSDCFSIEGFDLYSLQTELYPFILVCPPGMYCGNALEFRMNCCGRDLVLVFPQGAVPADRTRLVAEAIAECSRSLAFCNPGDGGGDETDTEPPTPGTVTRWYYNAPQTCQIACPDGSYFSNFIRAGIVAARSQNASNAIAYRYACSSALARRVCIRSFVVTTCANVAFSQRIIATGGGLAVPPLQNVWSIEAGALPTGYSLDSETGEISGTTTDFGDFVFTVKIVTPSGSSQTKDCDITIVGVLSETLPDGVVDSEFTYPLTQSGMTNPVWTVSAGALPDGLSLDSELGIISGTPTTEDSYAFTITATDDTNSCSADFTMDVNAALEITTASPLASATVGDPYSETLAATGGVAPYVDWSVIVGQLPDGLTLNTSTGEISGTPTTEETQNFTVQVTDTNGNLATKPFELAVSIAYPIIAWWNMEESGTNNRVDSIAGVSLAWTSIGAWTASSGTGITGNALRLQNPGGTTDTGAFINAVASAALADTGNGNSVVFWIKFSAFTGNESSVVVRWENASFQRLDVGFANVFGGGLNVTCNYGGTSRSIAQAFAPTLGAWYLFYVYLDPLDGKLHVNINNGATTYVSAQTGAVGAASASGKVRIFGSDNGIGVQNVDVLIDNVSVTPQVLDAPTYSAIWNGGAGHAWPL